jgi:cytochrome oxidase Cu insertion factor (SCO1/SenC/PrrC family)
MRVRLAVPLLLTGAVLTLAPAGAQAQAAASQYPLLDVGQQAPDFTLTGATRYGVLRDPVHLHDFRGKTVVLAFFFKARTRG